VNYSIIIYILLYIIYILYIIEMICQDGWDRLLKIGNGTWYVIRSQDVFYALVIEIGCTGDRNALRG